MSISQHIINTLKPLNIPVTLIENPVKAANKYVVLIPLSDNFEVFANNRPTIEVNEMELAIYVKGNYLDFVSQIVRLLLQADI